MKKTCLLLLLASVAVSCGKQEPPGSSTAPALIDTPEQHLLVLRQKGPYDLMNGAFGTVFAEAGRLQTRPAGIPFAVYYNDPAKTAPKEYEWEVCIPIPGKAVPQPPVKYRKQPAGRAAALVYTGEYGTPAHKGTYHRLLKYVAQLKGYRIAGPPVEAYLEIKGFQGGKKNITRILFPVIKK